MQREIIIPKERNIIYIGARMVDQYTGKTILLCPVCHKWFLAKRLHTITCGDACRKVTITGKKSTMSKRIYQSRVGRYARRTIDDLERLERKHMNTIKDIEAYVGYYPNRDIDLEKAHRLLREVRAEREAKILQHALL